MRYTAEEALSHAYIAQISSTLTPDVSPLIIPPEEFAYEQAEISIDILRKELLREGEYSCSV